MPKKHFFRQKTSIDIELKLLHHQNALKWHQTWHQAQQQQLQSLM